VENIRDEPRNHLNPENSLQCINVLIQI